MIGEKIKNLRTAKGLNIRALANIMEVDSSTISKYERGLATPRLPMITKLADALGVSVEYLSDEKVSVVKSNNKLLDKKLDEAKEFDFDTKTILVSIINKFQERKKFRDMVQNVKENLSI